MPNKIETRTIKFKTEFEKAKDFDAWINDIEKNLNKSTNKTFKSWLQEYKNKVKALEETFIKYGDELPNTEMASMHDEMKRMLPLSRKIAEAFSRMKLGDKGKKINQASEAIQAQEVKVRRAQDNKRNWEKKLNADNNGLSNREIERIYNSKVSKNPLSVDGKTYGGEGGLDAAQFVADFKKNTEAFYKARAELKVAVNDRKEQIKNEIKKYTTDFEQASKDLTDAKQALEDLKAAPSDDSVKQFTEQAVKGQQAANAFGSSIEDTKEAIKAVREDKEQKKEATIATKEFNKENKKTPGLIKKAATQVLTYGSIIRLFKTGVREAKRTITELDKALTDMAIVTSMSRKDAWEMVDSLQAIAKETGTTTTQVAATTTKFLQQGKSISQATELTKAALMAASIAGIDASRSVDLLTNAMNGFQMSASQALEVSDKFAALAAASATDYEELAVALSKVAAQANLAGMSMDFTLGMLAKGIEVTREAPETIGTALKTVVARMRELTDYGETLEEGMDVNRVETALENVGVKLRDANGQFRDLELVLTELGGKWDTLNVNQQANVAVALAGTRQQSRLIAMMQDFDRTMELVDISTNSYGATMAQQAEYMGSLQAATNNLTTAYEGLITNLVDSEAIIFIVNMLSSVVEMVGDIVSNSYALVPILVMLAMHGLTILSQKIAQHNYQKATNKLEKIRLKNQNKERLNAISIRKEELKAYINYLKAYDIKEDTLEAQLKIAKIQAEQNGNAALAAKYEKEIKELNADDLQEKITLQSAQSEYNALVAEEKAIHLENLSIQSSQFGVLGSLTSSAGMFVSSLVSTVGQFVQMIAMQKSLNKAKREETRERFKNVAAINAEKTANTANAGASMAGSAGKIPYVGWIIGAIILAAVLGLAIAGIASYMGKANKKEDDNVKSIEGNIKAVQKLQAEIYNLGQQVSTVSKLTDEFDTLSNKINKSAEDVARLEEIIQEFNDAVGFDLVAKGSDSDYALLQMRGYESFLKNQLNASIQKVNDTLAKAITNADKLTEYMNKAEGKAIIKQVLSQNNEDFAGASAITQSVIMQTIEKNPGAFVSSGGGLDLASLNAIFTSDLINEMDEAASGNSLRAYKEVYDGMTSAQKEYVASTNSTFAAVSKLTDSAIDNIDALKLTADQLAKLSPMFSKIQERLTGNGSNLSKGEILSLMYENRMSAFGKDLQNAADIQNEINKAQDAIDAYNEEIYSGGAGKKQDAIWDEYKDKLGSDIDITKLENDELKNIKTKNQLYEYLKKEAEGDNFNETEQALLKVLTEELGGYETQLQDAKDAQDMLNMGITEFFNQNANIKTITNLQDEITKAQSSMEKMGKAISGTLDPAELDELLNSYPILIDYLKDGVITGEEAYAARKAIYDETLSSIQAELDTVATKGDMLFNKYGLNWTQMIAQDADTVKNTLSNMGLEQSIYDELLGAWRDYIQYKGKFTYLEEEGIFSTEEAEKIGKNTGLALAKAQYNAYSKRMELYSKDEDGYLAMMGLSASAAINTISQAQITKNNAKAKIDNALKGYSYEIIDGELFYKDATNTAIALSEIQDEVIKAAFVGVQQDLIDAYQEADEEILENAENFANLYIDQKKHELEQEQEIIEKRKEAYEQYFEDVDALEEEQERAQSKQDIIKQLSALSTGVDGTTKSKIKDLQQQLNDLMKEEQQAQREAARNELLESLDEESERLANSMDTLDNSIGSLIRAIMGASVDMSGFSYNAASNQSMVEQLESYFRSIGVPGYASGGLVDYTGPALVHGTPHRPEAFLSADDTELMTSFLEALHLVFDTNNDTSDTVVSNNNSSITIENINIKTEQLNNEQDFKTAGSSLAQEFAAVIRERGLNINVRK